MVGSKLTKESMASHSYNFKTKHQNKLWNITKIQHQNTKTKNKTTSSRTCTSQTRKGHIKKSHGILRQPREMKYAWISSHLEEFDLNIMCDILNIPPSSYHSWANIDHTQREQKQHHDKQLIEQIFHYLKGNGGTRSIQGHLKNEYDFSSAAVRLEALCKH